jgi:hypothetical protein
MPDLFAQSAAWLEQNRAAFCASSVTYCRGSLSAPVPATIGKTTFEIENSSGIVTRLESRDYLIRAVDLLLAGFGGLSPEQLAELSPSQLDALAAEEPTLPQPTDTIQETFNGKTLTYELMPLGNQQSWRWSDPFRNTLRIHTKLVSEA